MFLKLNFENGGNKWALFFGLYSHSYIWFHRYVHLMMVSWLVLMIVDSRSGRESLMP